MTIRADAKITINELLPRAWLVRLRGLSPKVARALADGTEVVLREVERTVKTTTYPASGLQVRTGHLRRNIGSGPQGVFEVSAPQLFGPVIKLSGRIGSRVKYAGVQERGATIKARKAPRLVFNVPGVGWRTAQQVTIPARPYLDPAAKIVEKKVPQIIASRVNKVLKESL